MRRDPRAYLWDMREYAHLVGEFIGQAPLDRYLADKLLQSAVERQVQNLGEALAQLARIEPQLALRIPEHRQIVAFRNVLVHGYSDLNHIRVWETVHDKLPVLRAAVEALLTEPGPPIS
jgi:uncharacterized protein with HEPN domain